MQLKFNFDDLSENEMLWSELEDTQKKLSNLRRGLFGRYSLLQKQVKEMQRVIDAMNPQKCEILELPLFTLGDEKEEK